MAYLLPGYGLVDDVGGLLPGQGNIDLTTAEAEESSILTIIYNINQQMGNNMQILRQSTASQAIKLGVFVDDTDGKTAETGLTIANTDIQIAKDGGAFGNKNSGGGTHDADGWYTATLDATDTATVGLLDIQVTVAGALPVQARFQVIDTEIYDSIYADAATSLATEAKQDTIDTVVDGIATEIGTAGDGLTAINLPNQTMDISGNITGSLSGSVGSVTGAVGSVTADVNADVVKVSGDTDAANNLELMYDGTGYTDDTAPSSRTQVSSLSSGSAAISTTADSATVTTGIETLTYTATAQLDEQTHDVADDTGTEFYYEFNVGANGVPVEVIWDGYATNNGKVYTVKALNWPATYETVGTIDGGVSTAIVQKNFQLTNGHVGTGSDIGKVRFQFTSANGVEIFTDRILCSYAVVSQSVGYAEGAIWVDDSVSNTNTADYVDGTADNPVSTWAAALTLSASLGINKFHIANGTAIALSAAITEYVLYGVNWTLDLSDEAIGGAFVEGAITTGTGVEGASTPKFKECRFGAVTLPPAGFQTCGFGVSSGAFTAGADGQFAFVDCFSLVPGSGSPAFTFSGLASATGINNRGWKGGATYTLDSDCTLSHEVLAGGGTTVTTGGGDVEIRGITRSLNITMSAAETVQFVGTTGVITLSGTTTGDVNLYGVASSVADSTSAANITNSTVNATEVNTILADTNELQTNQGDWATAVGFATPTNITAGTIATVTNEVTADVTKISGSATAADNLEASALGIHSTTVATSASATEFTLTAGATANDIYIGRIVVVTSGTHAGEATDITDYVGATKTVTVTAFTGALSPADDIVIV